MHDDLQVAQPHNIWIETVSKMLKLLGSRETFPLFFEEDGESSFRSESCSFILCCRMTGESAFQLLFKLLVMQD